MESADPARSPEPADEGTRPEKVAPRTLSRKAFGLVLLAGVAGFLLIIFSPGLDRGTRIAASFVLAPVVVTPILGVTSKLTPETLLVGSVLGGEIAALLYASGQGTRFGQWLIAIELVALLLAPGTLRVLRLARVPGVPLDPVLPPTPTGVALIVLLAPFALVAAILNGMARFPVAAALGALVVSVIMTVHGAQPELIVIPVAMALIPAAIRWAFRHGRRSGAGSLAGGCVKVCGVSPQAAGTQAGLKSD